MTGIRDRLLDALSKISRGSAFLLIILLAFAALLQIPATQNLFANLLVSQKIDIVREISTGDFEDLEKRLVGTPGSEGFLADVKNWKTIQEKNIRFFENGFFLSFQAAKGDSLHSYFGFFRMKNGKITEILWNPNAKGEIVSLEKTPDEKYFSLNLKNVGSFPWSANDSWENAIDGQKTILLQNTPEGEIGTFVFSKNEGFLPKNETHGFLITGK